MPVFAYSSLGRGFFSGRITRESFAPENLAQTEEALDRACRTAYCHDVNLQRLERAIALAEQKGVTVPQIALAYILHSPLDVYPLVGAANGDEFAQNVQALDISLTDAERAWLNLEREGL
jgi:aryl-alcohol dehydrogenase-like predicted oxidoreductase